MVRPLLNEEKLQQLEELPFEQMRPEFIEQVMGLRRKVLNQMPIKKVAGAPIDASSWFRLLKLYVDAINEGRVPNIESSWHYLCLQKAEEQLARAAELFETALQGVQIPMSSVDLERDLNYAHETSVAHFRSGTEENSASIAPETSKYLTLLENSITERKQELMQKNA